MFDCNRTDPTCGSMFAKSPSAELRSRMCSPFDPSTTENQTIVSNISGATAISNCFRCRVELENTEFTPEEKEYVIRQLREITRNGPSELRALRQSDGFVPGLDSDFTISCHNAHIKLGSRGDSRRLLRAHLSTRFQAWYLLHPFVWADDASLGKRSPSGTGDSSFLFADDRGVTRKHY
jgi:hypothetical protein